MVLFGRAEHSSGSTNGSAYNSLLLVVAVGQRVTEAEMIAISRPAGPLPPSKSEIAAKCRTYLCHRYHPVARRHAAAELLSWADEHGVEFDIILATLRRINIRRQLLIGFISAISGLLIGQALRALILWLMADG